MKCAVQATTEDLLKLAKSTSLTFRRLRRELKACKTCEFEAGCPIIQEFNAAFDEALQRIYDEWNLQTPNPL